MDFKSFASAIAQIAEEKGIAPEKVIESLEQALAAAYKKDYGKKGQKILAKFNSKTGELRFWQVKLVVDQSMIYSDKELEKMEDKEEKISLEEIEAEKKVRFNPEKHIPLEEAKKIKPDIKPGEEFVIGLTPKKDYGRIAAQTAKQVILQKIREAERESVLGEFKSKEGEIISGIIQRVEMRNIFLDLGKTLGVLPRDEQVPGEFYRPGQRLKVFILKVEETPKGPLILLSRAYPKLVSKLFELEVPEVAADQVEIKSIAREPGSRTKLAVSSKVTGVDPIGSMVGQRGTRVMAVINELGGEKIDIVEYSEEPEKYIANAISPAKVSEVKIMPKNKALVLVPEDQLSLAIGRDGQNVRLAAKLTGWKIDVRPAEKVEEKTNN
ncbi:MAG: transcription termination factor NusA [Parcubacteria group bacterium CG1_02_36_42]|uniref:Transcription termination/antitermination protein NusA n=1 Tax=Candidatus Nealsonbacteria bacterium CG_4_9_14_0_8_um_filter_35_12 TaxID=1974692 RepID=A0A2M8DMV1_9BACT|nr:MAG: transcription termination factor NusA [Parcubacteria group bacterium CG1_02_36_42]PJB99459.1 MAG: transcription termination/antitermination protein NusA [Candidatus Nealsonbacteria bacterium CG_4_9_14_0_8_um_filter_35_12]